MSIKVIAFDLFGTVFDYRTTHSDDKHAYVTLLKNWKESGIYSQFPAVPSFSYMSPHPDAAVGIGLLKHYGYKVVAASNLLPEIVHCISEKSAIAWDRVMDFRDVKAYKPALRCYASICDAMNCMPAEVLFVTANPGSGDDTCPALIAMETTVIRGNSSCRDIVELASAMGPMKA